VSQAGEARRVLDFLGQTKATLVPLGFSPLCSGLLAQEVDVVLPLLDSAGAKMSQLEEVVGGRLEEGRALVEAIAEHVLLCFRSRDPQVSLELVAQGPDVETEEAAWVGVQDAVKLVAARFECQAEDT
jgi:hypothetical protein